MIEQACSVTETELMESVEKYENGGVDGNASSTIHANFSDA
jgi:hypothetical protein